MVFLSTALNVIKELTNATEPTGEIFTGGGGEVSGYENKGIF